MSRAYPKLTADKSTLFRHKNGVSSPEAPAPLAGMESFSLVPEPSVWGWGHPDEIALVRSRAVWLSGRISKPPVASEKGGVDNNGPVMMQTYSIQVLVGMALGLLSLGDLNGEETQAAQPNVVIVLTDDLGYSDFGCYGGEIRTPNIDRLAANGLRFTEFYNTSRCSPTRASLLTGQYSHRVGLDRNRKSLNENGLTLATVLQDVGYETAMVGKWHLTATVPHGDPDRQLEWLSHQGELDRPFGPKATYPPNRGFDRFYGTIWGVVNFFDPFSLMEDMRPVMEVPEDYYVTRATSDKAVEYIDEMAATENPFFLYAAYHAPHWPLHALPEDIARYEGIYDEGWRTIREARYRRQLEMGMWEEGNTPLPPIQGPDSAWQERDAEEREHLANLMEVHAAMIDRVDQGVGRIIDALREAGQLENTLLFILSDNGASPERYLNPGFDRPAETRDGRRIQYRGRFDPGPETTWGYIGPGWASAANTPFRYWKAEAYKGGTQTPLVVHWPDGVEMEPGGFVRERGHVIDIMPTVLEVAGAEYPSESDGRALNPMDGQSLAPVLQGEPREGHPALFFEHQGNKAVIRDEWKMNQLRGSEDWHLHNLAEDRTETRELIEDRADLAEELKAEWEEWARDVGVEE